MFSVWGRQYQSPAGMNVRIKNLKAANVQYGESDDRCSEIYALEQQVEALAAAAEMRRKAAERPYVVLYRKAKDNGDVFKGRRTFRTAAEQSRWISEAPGDVAITFYTN